MVALSNGPVNSGPLLLHRNLAKEKDMINMSDIKTINAYSIMTNVKK